ncbi:MAG: zinc ribbon domain-containing protein [Nanoarchaeota archaeon]|mgnify:CR=1 FL=1
MFCNNCGNELKPEAEFCGKCGKSAGNAAKEAPSIPSSEESKSNHVWKVVASILVFFVAFAVVRYLTQETVSSVMSDDPASKQEIIDATVQSVRSSTSFPYELDELTTWTGMTGTSNSLRYQYTLHDVDTSQLSNSLLKSTVVSSVCENQDTRAILDMDINMDYSYAVEGSSQTYFVSVSKADCI